MADTYYEIEYIYNNTHYTVYESHDIHEKLDNDPKYAEEYFIRQKYLLDRKGTNNDDEVSNEVDLETGGIENKENDFIWQKNSILLLLDEFRKRFEQWRNSKMKKKIVWTEIAAVMQSNGYLVDTIAVDRKIRNLKATYKKILDNNSKRRTGRGKLKWEYFVLLDDIFKNDKSIHVNLDSVMASLSSEDISQDLTECSKTISAEPIISTKAGCSSIPTTSSQVQEELSASNLNQSETNSAKKRRCTELNIYHKKQLAIESSKVDELKKMRLAIEASNNIALEKIELLKKLIDHQKK